MEVSKSKLKKLPMPGKPSKDPMLEADASEMDLEGPSSDAEPLAGDESPAEEAQELHQLPDDVLTKELEARGWHCTPPAKGEGSKEEEASESPNEESKEEAY